MLLKKYKLEERDKFGRIQWHHKMQCDIETCKVIWNEPRKATLRKERGRKGRKTPLLNKHLCPTCLDAHINSELAKNGTAVLKRLTSEERKAIASKAGKASQAKGTASKTWFTTERWNALTPEQQRTQVTRANRAMVAKVEMMSDQEKAAHYEKVMRGGLGYESIGQKELTAELSPYGFVGNFRISGMLVDICHPDKMIVIEYNGDAYHCNPKFWDKDQYSSLIKMKAGEKWRKDIARYEQLRKRGYTVIVVWESDWKTDRHGQLERIINRLDTKCIIS